MSEGWSIAVLGATGAVGEAILASLEERNFPVGELYLLASDRSAGETVRFEGKSVLVQDVAEFDWSLAQLAFFAAGETASLRYAEQAGDAGCLVIDSSGVFALEPDVPLIIPGVNDDVLVDYRNRNIIAVAESLTSQLLVAVKPLAEQAGLIRLTVNCLLSASAHGKKAVEELAGQSARLLNGYPFEPGFFQKQLAFNLLPFINDADGGVPQERRLVDEVRKVLQDNGIIMSVSCVQSPVFYGHAQSVCVEPARPLSVEESGMLWQQCEDIQLSKPEDYPTQVSDASGQIHLSIGCLRQDYGNPDAVQFWSVADNVKFGGALMAVKTAEVLIREYMY